jgi:hypothetical protein
LDGYEVVGNYGINCGDLVIQERDNSSVEALDLNEYDEYNCMLLSMKEFCVY